MNSSRLRSASAAPKLAITMMMTVLRRRAAARRAARRRAAPAPPVSTTATSAAIGSAQPKENGADRREQRRRRATPSAPATRQRDIGAPGDELAMGEIGEAQDRIGERDADRAEPDHRRRRSGRR